MSRIVKRLIAAAISFKPVGALISTSVQAALAELDVRAAMPGDVKYIAGSTPGAGWLKANGASGVAVAAYPALAAAIYCGDTKNATADWGYRYTNTAAPSTSRSTTGAYIMIPDLRGEFVRGFDDGRGVDAGRSMWALQSYEIQAHTHSGVVGSSAIGNIPSGGSTVCPTGNATIGSTGGTETRPRNVSLLAVIKY